VVVRGVLFKLLSQPFLKRTANVGLIAWWIAAEQNLIPDIRLGLSKLWIIEQPIDELLAFVRHRVVQKRRRFFEAENCPAKIEVIPPQKLRVVRRRSRYDFLSLPDGNNALIDSRGQFRSRGGPGTGKKNRQSEDHHSKIKCVSSDAS
jgi:hypothetical protein